MTGLIAVFLGLIVLFVLFFFPWLSVPMLLIVPVIKGGAEYYVPFFQSVDLTFVTCALAGTMGLWNLIRARRPGAPLAVPWVQVGCLLVLGFTLLVGLAWTSAPTYGLRKAYRFLGIGVPLLLLPSFLVRTKDEGHRMIRGIIVTGALVAVAVVALPETYFAQIAYGRGYARSTVLGSSPVIPAVLAAIAMLTLLCFYLVKGSASRALRYAVLLVLPFGLFTILRTGTRSVFFGLVAIVVVLPWLAGRGSRVKGVFLTFVVLPLMGALACVLIEAATGPSLQR